MAGSPRLRAMAWASVDLPLLLGPKMQMREPRSSRRFIGESRFMRCPVIFFTGEFSHPADCGA